MPTFSESLALLAAIREAHKASDAAALANAVKRADAFLADATVPAEQEIASLAVRDWSVEDGDPTEGAPLTAGTIAVSRSGYGIIVDATPPGVDGAHGLGIEFDRGAVHVMVYRAGYDDVQAHILLDGRGAHVSDGLVRGGHSVLFRGEEGAGLSPGEWQPPSVSPGGSVKP
jgi:hypothetical protein